MTKLHCLAVAKSKGGVDICGINEEVQKDAGEAMICGLRTVFTAVWQSGTLPVD